MSQSSFFYKSNIMKRHMCISILILFISSVLITACQTADQPPGNSNSPTPLPSKVSSSGGSSSGGSNSGGSSSGGSSSGGSNSGGSNSGGSNSGGSSSGGSSSGGSNSGGSSSGGSSSGGSNSGGSNSGGSSSGGSSSGGSSSGGSSSGGNTSGTTNDTFNSTDFSVEISGTYYAVVFASQSHYINVIPLGNRDGKPHYVSTSLKFNNGSDWLTATSQLQLPPNTTFNGPPVYLDVTNSSNLPPGFYDGLDGQASPSAPGAAEVHYFLGTPNPQDSKIDSKIDLQVLPLPVISSIEVSQDRSSITISGTGFIQKVRNENNYLENKNVIDSIKVGEQTVACSESSNTACLVQAGGQGANDQLKVAIPLPQSGSTISVTLNALAEDSPAGSWTQAEIDSRYAYVNSQFTS